ncbi:vacuolar protein sorting-associated protein 9A-like isoform X2 [Dioscorea cayenensis subsp. rotundata]|uniref:Vacuolar protein sorting-associated protein 9A-like isoform X2 n=1 Tax=Dioscorea cayennensis subsp. rotundata TaxID=55577 RepID=A0AB40AJL3_DIOCR|nr:vacuolar protein sorting-associated protein 9A-like isoform X2 [Dioscorea cayenensis subsp. rotundata]
MDAGGGGNTDVFGSSTAPLTWHDFLDRMRHPSAADFVKSIKSFIVSFSNRAPDPEKDSASVQEFLLNMEGAFKVHMLWAGSSEEELESAGEGLEKYIMTKLFNRAFASLPEDVKHDEELYEKISLLQQFVTPENLDIKPNFRNETSWLDNPPGADDFLPVLIYVTLKANPPQLYSNLLYIERYRRRSRLVSESAYFFTNIVSAESFIWNITAESLSMDEMEFQRKMDSARAYLLGQSTDIENLKDQANESIPDHKTQASEVQRSVGSYMQKNVYNVPPTPIVKAPSLSDLENKGASEILKDDQPIKYFQEYPFLFAQPGDLTVDDVENLLNCYKQLVFKYISLSKGMGIPIASPAASGTQSQSKADTDKESEGVIEEETSAEKV